MFHNMYMEFPYSNAQVSTDMCVRICVYVCIYTCLCMWMHARTHI